MSSYLSHWGADRPIFTRPVIAGQEFQAASFVAARDRIEQFLHQDHALLAVSGFAGTGKTLLSQWLHQQLSLANFDVFMSGLLTEINSPNWLLPRLAGLLGVEASNRSPDAVLGDIITAFDKLALQQRRLVFIIDNAHQIQGHAAWDELVGLTGIPGALGPAMTFILVGREQLNDQLDSHPELAGRLSSRVNISPLAIDEIHPYILHKAKQAEVRMEIDHMATDRFWQVTQGVPAAIDKLAENAAVEAALANSSFIDVDHVQKASLHTVAVRRHVQDFSGASAQRPMARTGTDGPFRPTLPWDTKPSPEDLKSTVELPPVPTDGAEPSGPTLDLDAEVTADEIALANRQAKESQAPAQQSEKTKPPSPAPLPKSKPDDDISLASLFKMTPSRHKP